MDTELTRTEEEIVAVYDAHYDAQFKEGISFRVGRNGITQIIPYEEVGSMAMVPRVKVLKNDALYCTLPINNLCIEYKQ